MRRSRSLPVMPFGGRRAFLLALLLIQWGTEKTAATIKVADILVSEKSTPSTILQNKKNVQQASEGSDKCGGVNRQGQVTSSKYSSLFQKYPLLTMTEDYNKDVPPQPDHGGPVQVDFYMLLVDIRDINEVEEEMSLEYNLQMYWKDERLTQWDRNSTKFQEAMVNGSEYEVISAALINDIWHPDIFIDHAKKIDQHKVLKTPASLRLYYEDGEFRYSGRFTMKIACQMQFHYYPADSQRCPVNIKSYGYDNRTVFVTWKDGKEPAMKKSITLPNFAVGIGGAESNRIITSSNIYSEIKFIVILRRFLGFHLIQTYLPSCLFVVISFLTFLVSRESVLECLTLCMTTLLTLTAMFASVKQNTPSVSYVKGLDIWMVTCIFCVFFTLLEHTVLLKLRTQITEKVQKKASDPNSDKSKCEARKRKKNMFALAATKIIRKRIESPKQSTRPSQEPLTPFYQGSKKGGSSDSESDSTPNVQLRRYPQPTPPASIHLSPPSPMLGLGPMSGNGQFNPPVSPATMAHRLSLGQCHTPVMMNQDAFLLSTPLTPQFASMLSRKATKRFKFSRNFETFFAKLIPISFIVFNAIYWPWLLQSADYYNDTAFKTTNFV